MAHDDDLLEVLEDSRRWGFLGPGPVDDHVEHADRLLDRLDEVLPDGARCLDLGSGGGVPGLVLARRRPTWSWTLLDAQLRRTDFLAEAVRRLDLGERVEVVRDRAEDAGRTASHRVTYDAVVARSFGPPAVTAECAAPLLRAGGYLLVSEPPTEVNVSERWPADGLDLLGLVQDAPPRGGWALMQRVGPLDDRYPRPSGRPAKRPLWS